MKKISFCIAILIIIGLIVLGIYKNNDETNIQKKCSYNENLTEGVKYIDGIYEYSYMQEYDGEKWININKNGWGVRLIDTNIKSVNESPCIKINDIDIVSTAYMFANMENINSINLKEYNTNSITNMKYMFYKTGYNVMDKVTINLGKIDTPNVTNMEGMFELSGFNSNDFEVIGMNNWNTEKVTNFSNMFYYSGYNSKNYSLGDISNWNLEKAENINNMFYEAGANSETFEIGDLNRWSVAKNAYKYYAFENTGKTSNYSKPIWCQE